MRSFITMAALVAAALPLAPASAQTMRGYTSVATRLYAGPLRDYPTVRYVRRGVRVGVHGCLRDWSWCDVTYRSNRGWIAGNALRISHDGRRQGLSADLGIGVISFSFGSYWDNNYRGRTFYNERPRWQTQYENGYRPEWGDRDQGPRQGPSGDQGQYRDRRGPGVQPGQDLRVGDHRVPAQGGQIRRIPATGGTVRVVTPNRPPAKVRVKVPARKAQPGNNGFGKKARGGEKAHGKPAGRQHP
ncbi:MAG: hypothetical protein WCL10_02655 [Novosphingobium sp.]|uniref:SH3 domain-containing protein n=1 Tax=Novosphingobium sp. TaxID=1874826 RepID=UPI003018C68E